MAAAGPPEAERPAASERASAGSAADMWEDLGVGGMLEGLRIWGWTVAALGKMVVGRNRREELSVVRKVVIMTQMVVEKTESLCMGRYSLS